MNAQNGNYDEKEGDQQSDICADDDDVSADEDEGSTAEEQPRQSDDCMSWFVNGWLETYAFVDLGFCF